LTDKFAKVLVVIPARGGSKGIPGKNIKPLAGKPLIQYTIDTARQLTSDSNIYLSTDSDEIIQVAEKTGYRVPFKRPAALATDQSGMREVLLHSLDTAIASGLNPQMILLLQPTSPFRKRSDVEKSVDLYSPDLDMVVSVKETDANPYYILFEENEKGYLELSKPGNYKRRQDCPPVYQYNGSVYVINPDSLRNGPISQFSRVRKFIMDRFSSVDLDSPEDWYWAEFLLGKKLVQIHE
jgi:CMP-N,N'-diacetyllegionaminic acid synthase